ncbi:MAG: hypothetical protein F6K19_46780 [Cyanothece sp. SIO1E1]|nr:hypothetical protein [Cyanothece sp. SIO1E1]
MNADERSGNRLERIETLVEANAQQIARNSQQISQNSQQIAENSQLSTRNSQLITESNQTILQLADYQASMFRGLAEITQAIRQLTKRVDSLAASSERHDRILDYLLRRDSEGRQ